MRDEPQIFSIPLFSFNSPSGPWPLETEGQNTESVPTFKVRGEKITGRCYGVRIEDDSMVPVLCPGMVAVFSQEDQPASALKGIFSLGRKNELPVVRRVVRNEIREDEKAGSDPGKGKMRKSFMTPTPLHIPKSRISPVAVSTHQMIYFKRLAPPDELTLLPAGNILWMHPLMLIVREQKDAK